MRVVVGCDVSGGDIFVVLVVCALVSLLLLLFECCCRCKCCSCGLCVFVVCVVVGDRGVLLVVCVAVRVVLFAVIWSLFLCCCVSLLFVRVVVGDGILVLSVGCCWCVVVDDVLLIGSVLVFGRCR